MFSSPSRFVAGVFSILLMNFLMQKLSTFETKQIPAHETPDDLECWWHPNVRRTASRRDWLAALPRLNCHRCTLSPLPNVAGLIAFFGRATVVIQCDSGLKWLGKSKVFASNERIALRNVLLGNGDW